ncbi:hypothetical protein AVEN_77989-1 [Araneus ventricosus]|uniref:Uncharacterized protein n=1 Tax=Araneus ventricosus TaxID=182803 RepID=A0A4Y2MH43_ARAVE|nr:hypothetical protein AVEN_77989-1 [Araneus ventricosus]
MHPSASLRGSRENAPIEFLQSGEKGAEWPPLLLQHIVSNSDAVDLQVATARTRSCGRRLNLQNPLKKLLVLAMRSSGCMTSVVNKQEIFEIPTSTS